MPYIEPVVVIHGRGAKVDLSDSTTVAVHGLDGFDVAGVPHSSELLKGAGRPGDLDKPQVDALVRLLVNCGLVPPRRPQPVPASTPAPATTPEPATVPSPETTDSAQPVNPTGTREPADSAAPSVFDGVTDLDLRELGVDEDSLGTVRAATSIESLIGELPDDLWDDLDAVAGGEPVDDVVDRRRSARDLLAEVDELADAVGWSPSPSPNESTPAVRSADRKAEDRSVGPLEAADESSTALPSDLIQQLRDAFGDSVTVRTPRPRAAAPRAARLQPSPAVPAPSDVSVPAEALLGMARTEALAGRLDAAADLHDLVRARLDSEYVLDWSLDEVVDLSRALQRHRHASRRLAQMAADLREGTPRAPHLTGRPTTTVGSLWDGADLGPAYSLLVRVPDVLDRRSGLFLSQLIGDEAAANVNARLRIGRPDGGRVRIARDGTVVSRRDADSPWFVVGHVEQGEWYPPERLLTA